jgi:CDGSH-type Zn-finger protein
MNKSTAAEAKVQISENGPYLVCGSLPLLTVRTNAFCDGQHAEIGFQAGP